MRPREAAARSSGQFIERAAVASDTEERSMDAA
jgi:hypothetical protein